MYLTKKLYWDSLTHLLFLYLLFRTSPLLNLFLLLRLTSFQENVHFHTFSTPPFHQGGLKALLQQCNHPFSSINLLRYYISDTDPNSIAEHVQKCPIRFIGKDFANIWEFERGKRVHIFYVLVLTSIFYVFIGDTFEFYMWTISRHDILSIKSEKS